MIISKPVLFKYKLQMLLNNFKLKLFFRLGIKLFDKIG